MIRRVFFALLAASVAAGALVWHAREGAAAEAHARAESAERLVDEQATRIDRALDLMNAEALHSARVRCRGGPEDGGDRLAELRDPTRVPAGPTDRLRRLHITLDGGPDGVALVHPCASGMVVAVHGWTLDGFEQRLATAARVHVAGSESLGPPDAVDLRQQTIRRGDLPEIVTWASIERAPAEPRGRTWALAAGVAAGVFLLVLLAGGGGARPDRKLEAAARRVGEGDLDVTLDGSSPTASAFNRMTRELKDARTRLARAERIAAWRDIARRIAHEIKNPLTPIKMAMETLRKTHARKHPDFDEIFEESTKTVLEETARLEHIVTEFSRFARMPRPKAESIDVTEVVERVVSMHDLPAAAATLPEAAKGVRVELSKPDAPLSSVRADREQLTQVLVNLVQNACDAAREKQGETGGRVEVRLERAPDEGVRIVVADNGPGIPLESRIDVLEPYYTTKSHGTGLGLAIVDRIVSDHGGTLALGDDAVLRGAAVTITLRREGPSDEPESSVGV